MPVDCPNHLTTKMPPFISEFPIWVNIFSSWEPVEDIHSKKAGIIRSCSILYSLYTMPASPKPSSLPLSRHHLLHHHHTPLPQNLVGLLAQLHNLANYDSLNLNQTPTGYNVGKMATLPKTIYRFISRKGASNLCFQFRGGGGVEGEGVTVWNVCELGPCWWVRIAIEGSTEGGRARVGMAAHGTVLTPTVTCPRVSLHFCLQIGRPRSSPADIVIS